MTDVYTYTNHRRYLADFVEAQRERNAKFSLRTFAKRSGIGSPSHLNLVIKGERRLTLESIEKFAVGTGLKGRERDYFREMVQFNQKAEPQEKVQHLERMRKLRFGRVNVEIDVTRAMSLYEKWYYPLIYEMVALKNFIPSGAYISSNLKVAGRSVLTELQATEALKKLTASGMIVVGGDSTKLSAQQIQHFVRSSDEVESALVQNFHREMLKISETKLADPFSSREFGGLTLATTPEKFLVLKQMIKTFLAEANAEGSVPSGATEMVHLSVQLVKLVP